MAVQLDKDYLKNRKINTDSFTYNNFWQKVVLKQCIQFYF
jgi:hypothetical protein